MSDQYHLVARIDELEAENKKLLKVAKAAGAYLDAFCWEDDNLQEYGEALASAMNEWKGIVR